MESIIGLYKTECIRTAVFHDRPYKTVTDVEYATAGWVDWYNHRRLHSRLGGSSRHAQPTQPIGGSRLNGTVGRVPRTSVRTGHPR